MTQGTTPQNNNRRVAGIVVGATATALVLAGGVAACNILQRDGDTSASGDPKTTSPSTSANSSSQTPSSDDATAPIPGQVPDQNGETYAGIDPTSADDTTTTENDSDRGSRLVVNADGSTTLVQLDRGDGDTLASGSRLDDSGASINPSAVEVPSTSPSNENAPSTITGDDDTTINNGGPTNGGGGNSSDPSDNQGSTPGGGDNGGGTPTDPTDPNGNGGGDNGGNNGGGDNGGGDGGGGGTRPDPNDPDGNGQQNQDRVNIDDLLSYINLQRGINDANGNLNPLDDSISTDRANPDPDLYRKNGGVVVIVDDKGTPIGIWSDMTQQEKDAFLQSFGKYDDLRLYGIREGESTTKIGVDQYVLKPPTANDDTFEVEKGNSIEIDATQLLANDKALDGQITNVDTKGIEGVTWDARTGKVTIDTSKFEGDPSQIKFEYTIRHTNNPNENKSGNTDESTAEITVNVTPVQTEPEPEPEPTVPAVPPTDSGHSDGSGTDTPEADPQGTGDEVKRASETEGTSAPTPTAQEAADLAAPKTKVLRYTVTQQGAVPIKESSTTTEAPSGEGDQADSQRSRDAKSSDSNDSKESSAASGRRAATTEDGERAYSDKAPTGKTGRHEASNDDKTGEASSKKSSKATSSEANEKSDEAAPSESKKDSSDADTKSGSDNTPAKESSEQSAPAAASGDSNGSTSTTGE